MMQKFAVMMQIFVMRKHIFAKMMMIIVITHCLVLTADNKKTITEDNVALLQLLFVCPHLSMKNFNRVQIFHSNYELYSASC